jgi:hypothetical protein
MVRALRPRSAADMRKRSLQFGSKRRDGLFLAAIDRCMIREAMIKFRMTSRKAAVWVAFTGVVTRLDLLKLREAGAVVLHAEGNADVILDFSGATRLDVSDRALEAQGAEAPHAPDKQRAMVVNDHVRGQALFYRDCQARSGFKPPVVLETVDEAMRLFGCRKEEFKPVDTSWLDELEIEFAKEVAAKIS